MGIKHGREEVSEKEIESRIGIRYILSYLSGEKTEKERQQR